MKPWFEPNYMIEHIEKYSHENYPWYSTLVLDKRFGQHDMLYPALRNRSVLCRKEVRCELDYFV